MGRFSCSGVPMALAALAIAQMGVHLAFFLHITTGPDNTNNALALAFVGLIVFVLVFGTVWVMAHMNANMMPMGPMKSNACLEGIPRRDHQCLRPEMIRARANRPAVSIFRSLSTRLIE